MSSPRLTIIAGANGSGKTTLTRWNPEDFHQIPLLDPDSIAKTLQSTLASTIPIAAARQVLKAAKEHIAKRASFAVETTLSGQGYPQMMVEARANGFEIVLVYIGTANVEINLARIYTRVLGGGHDVPEPDVRRRYVRSFKNLAIAIERADHTILFDNSSEEGYRLIAILSSGESQWFEPLPDWAARVANRF